MKITKIATTIIYTSILNDDYSLLENICPQSPKLQKIVRKYFRGKLRHRCVRYFGPNAYQKEISEYWNRIKK